jgi:hypothetical protein
MCAEFHVIYSLAYFELKVFTSTLVKILTITQLPFIPAECPHHCWDSRLKCAMCTHPPLHRQFVFSHRGKMVVCSVPGSSWGMPTSWVTMNIDAVFSSETLERLITTQCRNPLDNHHLMNIQFANDKYADIHHVNRLCDGNAWGKHKYWFCNNCHLKHMSVDARHSIIQ